VVLAQTIRNEHFYSDWYNRGSRFAGHRTEACQLYGEEPEQDVMRLLKQLLLVRAAVRRTETWSGLEPSETTVAVLQARRTGARANTT
jgi:hypothetical protein